MVAAIHCYLTTAMAVEYTEDRFVIVFKELKIDEMCIFLQNQNRSATYHIESPTLHAASGIRNVLIATRLLLDLRDRLVEVAETSSHFTWLFIII